MFPLYKSKLQAKLMLLYVMMSILPICLISILAFSVYSRSILQKSNALVEQNAHLHERVIYERLRNQKSIIYELVTNKKIIELTGRMDSADDSDAALGKRNLSELFQSYVWSSPYVYSIAIISDGDSYAYYSKRYSNDGAIFWAQQDFRQRALEETRDADNVVYFPTVRLPSLDMHDNYALYLAYPVRDLPSRETHGVLVLELDATLLQPYNTAKGSGVTTLIAGDGNQVLSSTETAYITRTLEEFYEETFAYGNAFSEIRTPISDTGWDIVSIIDKSVYLYDINVFAWIVIVFTVLVSLTFFTIVFFIFRGYTSSINSIASTIQNYATGEKNASMEIDSKDDLYIIASQFNQMTRDVNRLMDALEKKNTAIRLAVNRQKRAEIKALEAQINPHFLYNTLDSINWMAIERNQIEVSNALGRLGELLRYSVSNIDMVVTLRQEINWLNNYAFLQMERFSYAFRLETDVELGALNCRLHKLLLQPLVENCILHGFEGMRSGGVLRVGASVGEDDLLTLTVEDNGAGIPAKMLASIRASILDESTLDGESIGILNTINRVKLYYRGHARIEVDSEPGNGTRVTLHLPPPQMDADT